MNYTHSLFESEFSGSIIAIRTFSRPFIAPPREKEKEKLKANKSEHVKSSDTETESRREKFSRFKEDVDNSEKNARNGKKIMDTKESSCQTELDEILRRQKEEFEDEWEQVRWTMEEESAEEKEDFESRVRNEYNEIIKAKDELIRVLTE